MKTEISKKEINRNDFFTVATASRFVISFKGEQIFARNLLIAPADPKRQIWKNIKEANQIIKDLENGSSVYVSAQNRVNELNAKPSFAGDYVLNNLSHQNFIK